MEKTQERKRAKKNERQREQCARHLRVELE